MSPSISTNPQSTFTPFPPVRAKNCFHTHSYLLVQSHLTDTTWAQLRHNKRCINFAHIGYLVIKIHSISVVLWVFAFKIMTDGFTVFWLRGTVHQNSQIAVDSLTTSEQWCLIDWLIVWRIRWKIVRTFLCCVVNILVVTCTHVVPVLSSWLLVYVYTLPMAVDTEQQFLEQCPHSWGL